MQCTIFYKKHVVNRYCSFYKKDIIKTLCIDLAISMSVLHIAKDSHRLQNRGKPVIPNTEICVSKTSHMFKFLCLYLELYFTHLTYSF